MNLQTRLRRLEAKENEAITAAIQARLNELGLEPYLPAALATPAGQALQAEWGQLAEESGCSPPAKRCRPLVDVTCDVLELAARIKWERRGQEYGA